jgi:hypothetical protein
MLCDLYFDGRKVEDLAFFFGRDGLLAQITAAFRADISR